MDIYIGLLAIYILLIFIERVSIRKGKLNLLRLKIWNSLLLLPIWFLISFRDESVGKDTFMYKYLYEKYGQMPLIQSLITSKVEKGFVIFMNILKHVGFSFYTFQLIVATITCIFIGIYIYKYSLNYAFSWYLFIVLLFLPRCMNVSREMLAVSISVIAFNYLINKKIKMFIVVCIFTFFIHKTSILQLLVLPMLIIKKDRYLKIITVLVSVTVVLFFENIINVFVRLMGKYDYIIGGKYIGNYEGFAKYVNLVFAILIVTWYYLSFNKDFKHLQTTVGKSELGKEYEYKLWKIYLLLNVIFGFCGLKFGLADRASLYFMLPFIVLIPNLLQKERINNRIVLSVSIITISGIYFYSVMLLRNNWHSIVPYRTWLSNTI